MLSMFRNKSDMVSAGDALVGREFAIPTADTHFVLDTPLKDLPDGMEVAIFGMGCFWGVERMFWKLDGVYSTSVGYAGGYTPNATYEEVCTGKTGHNEVVRIVFDPAKIRHSIGRGFTPHLMRRPKLQKPANWPLPRVYCLQAMVQSQQKSCRRLPTIMLRNTISSIWPKTPMAIAGSAVRA